jgi:hypothetical protein
VTGPGSSPAGTMFASFSRLSICNTTKQQNMGQ